MTLYEMTQQAAALYELLQNEDIDAQTYSDTLEAIGADKKLESYAIIITQLKADIEMIKGQEERLEKKRTAAENAVKRMQDNVVAFMQASGQKKAKAGTFDISLRNSEKVNVIDEKAVSREYFTSQAPKISLTAIKEAIKAGITVTGAELVTNTSATIK